MKTASIFFYIVIAKIIATATLPHLFVAAMEEEPMIDHSPAAVVVKKNYRPVVCGTEEEVFSNLCIAINNGGYSKTDCVDQNRGE